MRRVRCTAYGPPETLVLEDAPRPEPKPDEVLIRVAASTLSAGDCELRRFEMGALYWLPLRLFMGIFRPRNLVLGQDVAGTVEAVGARVKRLAVGDKVFGLTGMRFGGHADYVCLPEAYPLVRAPSNLTPAEAVSLPVGAYNAREFFKQAAVKPGDRLLINGAGGTIGTMAIQLAKLAGATVTAVDAGAKLGALKVLGADDVIDYQRQSILDLADRFDAIIDLVNRTPAALSLLKDGGHYVLGNPAAGQTLGGKRTDKKTGKTVIPALAGYDLAMMEEFRDLAERGELLPAVDRIYALEQAAEAHTYVESGAKTGSVILAP